MTLHKKSYVEMLRAKSKTLFIPFLVASLLILLASTGLKLLFKNDISYTLSIKWLIKAVFLHPQSDQFWYLRDLIVLTIISPLIICIGQNKRLLLLIITAILWLIDYQPFPITSGWYLLNIETIFFFIFGGILFDKKSFLHSVINTRRRNKITIFSLWLFLVAARIYIDPTLDVWYVRNYTLFSVLLYKISILFGIISLIQLSTVIASNRQVIYLSGLTFFAYLFHLVPLSHFKRLTNTMVTEAYGFYINFPFALLVVFVIAHFASKLQPKAFAFITGGRNPNKALKRTQ